MHESLQCHTRLASLLVRKPQALSAELTTPGSISKPRPLESRTRLKSSQSHHRRCSSILTAMHRVQLSQESNTSSAQSTPRLEHDTSSAADASPQSLATSPPDMSLDILFDLVCNSRPQSPYSKSEVGMKIQRPDGSYVLSNEPLVVDCSGKSLQLHPSGDDEVVLWSTVLFPLSEDKPSTAQVRFVTDLQCPEPTWTQDDRYDRAHARMYGFVI